MTLDSRHLLACVIALVLGGVRVLDALGVHDTEAGLLFPSIALSGRANRFFLGLAPEWNPDPGQAARSIAEILVAVRQFAGSIRHWHFKGTARRRKRHTPGLGLFGLSRNPLSQMHRSTFLPIQPAATLISSVDWFLDPASFPVQVMSDRTRRRQRPAPFPSIPEKNRCRSRKTRCIPAGDHINLSVDRIPASC